MLNVMGERQSFLWQGFWSYLPSFTESVFWIDSMAPSCFCVHYRQTWSSQLRGETYAGSGYTELLCWRIPLSGFPWVVSGSQDLPCLNKPWQSGLPPAIASLTHLSLADALSTQTSAVSLSHSLICNVMVHWNTPTLSENWHYLLQLSDDPVQLIQYCSKVEV